MPSSPSDKTATGPAEILQESHPDLWIIRLDNLERRTDMKILNYVSHLYGIYVFDRQRHVYCHDLEPFYELHFLGSQWACTLLTDTCERYSLGSRWETGYRLTDTEGKELSKVIREEDAKAEDTNHFDVVMIDRILDSPLRANSPPSKDEGAVRINVPEGMTSGDMIEKIKKLYLQSEH